MISRWSHSIVVPLTAILAVPGIGTRATRSAPESAVPVVSTLAPVRAGMGSPGINLTVEGSQFDINAQVRWNGAQRPTTFVNPTRLIAAISAQDLGALGTAQVTVVNPNTGGGTSNAMAFSIVNPIPAIASVSPNTAPVQGEDMAIVINGAGFLPTSVVRVNGASRPTTYYGWSRVVGRVLSSDLAAAGSSIVTVSNPAPGGGTSAADTLRIVLMTPAINTLTPKILQFGSTGFSLRVRGVNFVRSAVVHWNGAPRTTTWINSSELDAAIPATDVDVIGMANVTVAVTVPNVGSRTSTASPFSVASPAPTFAGMPTPLPVVRLQPVQMTFGGTNFLPGMQATVNNVTRPTTVVSANLVRVTLDAADVAQAGQISVRLVNPLPTLGIPLATLGVVNPLPVATSLSPKNVYVGGQPFTLTVNGSGFVPGAMVQANGVSRPTTFVSRTQLTAAIPASDLTQGGDLPITVVTPAPGGGTSAQLAVTRLYQQIIVK